MAAAQGRSTRADRAPGCRRVRIRAWFVNPEDAHGRLDIPPRFAVARDARGIDPESLPSSPRARAPRCGIVPIGDRVVAGSLLSPRRTRKGPLAAPGDGSISALLSQVLGRGVRAWRL